MQSYTRYERARIIGARALQISMGAPLLIKTEKSDPLEIAIEEFQAQHHSHHREEEVGMTIIQEIQLRTILDSRGNPTVEADIYTESGFGRASAPSGASTGKFEAKVRSPEDAVVSARESLVPKLIGEDSRDQVYIDGLLREIDGTSDFSTIGANVAVALSLAKREGCCIIAWD